MNATKELVICHKCGRVMRQVRDPITKKYTGYLWRCKCMPKNLVMARG